MARNVIEEYLVSLGYEPDIPSFNRMRTMLEDAERIVEQHSYGIARHMVEAQAAITGGFISVSAAILGVMDKSAMADQSWRLMGLRMMTTTDQARKLDLISKTLGVSLAEMVWDPELHQRALVMSQDIDRWTHALGPDFEKNMRGIRDMRMEFGRLEIAVEFLGMKFASDVFKKLFPDKDAQQTIDGWITNLGDHIPEISDKLSNQAVPALKTTWNILKDLGSVVKDGVVAFQNLIGLFSGDQRLMGETADFDKLALSIQHVAHGAKDILGVIVQAEKALAHLASGVSLGLAGKFEEATTEFTTALHELTTGSAVAMGSLLGPAGTVAGAAIGAGADAARAGKLGPDAQALAGVPSSGIGSEADKKEQTETGESHHLLAWLGGLYAAKKLTPAALRLLGRMLGGGAAAESAGAVAGTAAGTGVAGASIGAAAGLVGIDLLLAGIVGNKYYEYFTDPTIDNPIGRLFGSERHDDVPDIGQLRADRLKALRKRGDSTGSADLLGIKPTTTQGSTQPGGQSAAIVAQIIGTALEKGVSPALALAIAKHESQFNPNAKNVNPATKDRPSSTDWGLFQLNDSTVKTLGVKNPFDPTENMQAGIGLIGRLYEKYHGDIPKLEAAYAAGEGFVDSHPDQSTWSSEVKKDIADIVALEKQMAQTLAAALPLPQPVASAPSIPFGYTSDQFAVPRKQYEDPNIPHITLQTWHGFDSSRMAARFADYQDAQRQAVPLPPSNVIHSTVTVDVGGIVIREPNATPHEIKRVVNEAIQEKLDHRTQLELVQLSPVWS